MNYEEFFNEAAKRRKPPKYRQLTTQMFQHPEEGWNNLMVGSPMMESCPIKGITVNLVGGRDLNLTQADLDKWLWYTDSKGIPRVVNRIKGLLQEVFNPPHYKANGESFEVMLTCGSLNAFMQTIDTIMDVDRDAVIYEEATYAPAHIAAEVYGLNVLQIEMDDEGMIPCRLDQVVSDWMKKTGRAPKLLYTIPTGQNPTGVKMSPQRIKDIYQIARKHNLLIYEDDAYYFVSLEKDQDNPTTFFSLDVDGRVLRADTFSKIIAPGLRLGSLAGPKPLMDKISCHQMTTVQFPCAIAQLIVYGILNQWGTKGFLGFAQRVSQQYQQKREFAIKTAEKMLKGLAEWTMPRGGMFIWIRLKGINDTFALCEQLARDHHLMIYPGSESVGKERCSYIRVSYAEVLPHKFEDGLRILSEVLRGKQENGI